MKLEEIHKVSSISNVNFKLVSNILDKALHVKDNIYKIIDVANHIYVIIENGEMIAYLYLIPFSNDVIKKGYVSKEIWVHHDYRFKGYGSILYMYVIKTGYSILSDSEQTQGGISSWNKLSNLGTVQMYDVTTGQILDKSNDILYGNDKYRLILTEYSVSVVPEGLKIADITLESVIFPILRLTDTQLGLF